MNTSQNHSDGAGACTYIIRRSDESFWAVSTPDRRVGGTFRSFDDARHFARSEVRCHPHGEVVVLGDDFCDVETFDGSRLSRTVRWDGSPVRRSGAAA